MWHMILFLTDFLVTMQLLAKDLSTTLFERDSPEASRLKIEIVRSKNLIISGGHWKNDVMEWLKKKGF